MGCCATPKAEAIKKKKKKLKQEKNPPLGLKMTLRRAGRLQDFVSHGGQIAAFSAVCRATLPVSPLCTETLSFISKMLRSSCS